MVEIIRKIGIITKGIVYSILGFLTLLAAIGSGGKISGKNEVISFLEDQTFGNILLILLCLGLYFYSFWKLYSAFLDGKKEGSDKAGIAKRIGYFFSGIIYGALATSTILNFLDVSSNADLNTKRSATETLLQSASGVVVLYIVSVILLGVGVYQIYKGYSKKFLDDLNIGNEDSKQVIEKTGIFGHIARGISFLIFAFFVFMALQKNESEQIKGIQGMFNFLQSFSWGNILMGLMAVGFICYGVYQYFLARFSSLN
ncbi:DUF1206 domain-containing protein [uncultured Polaribacter sp.]|uniref:DUF1206 domain-containing protein n=1 Tax=uncultured Polaribacter sp. TaxID=174711 RepID=UPI002636E238|nr:DUF1206 domain-containing protein [uncultured Polaribacter sp.]